MTKINKGMQELKQAKALVKTGLYKDYEYEDYTGTYVLIPVKSFHDNEAVPLVYANEEWKMQAFLNKLDPKFCHKLYQLAIRSKQFIDVDKYWEPFDKWLHERYQNKLANDIFWYINDNYRKLEGYFTYLPSTRALMYRLAKDIFNK